MSLRETAMRGGGYLAGREVLGIAVRFVGVLLVTRFIGPSDFGIYSGVLALVTLLATFAQLGAEVFLIRSEEEPAEHVYDQVFSVLLISTAATVVLGLIGSFVVSAFVGQNDFVLPFQVLLLALPLGVLWAPAQAKIERRFHFRHMAMAQLTSDIVLYVVAVPLAIAGVGLWAPIVGTFASYGCLLVLSYIFAAYRPRLAFSRALTLRLARFGAAFTPAGMLARVEYLVNPLVVGPILGAASVGYVALALRLVDTASFILRATFRVSLVAFARVQRDEARLRRGFEETMSLQVLALSPLLVGFTVASPWLLPLLFGDEWKPTLEVLPLVAASTLAFCVFNAHCAVLYVLGRTAVVSAIELLRVILLFLGALLLVPLFGLVGYGVALLVTSLGWWLAHREVRKLLRFRYGLAAMWTAVFLPPLFFPLVESTWWRPVLFVPLLIALRNAGARAQLRQLAVFVKAVTALMYEPRARS